MRSRLAPVVLVTTLAVLPVLSGCGSGGGKITMSGSPVRPTTTLAPGTAETSPPSDAPTDAPTDGSVGTIPGLPDDLQACTDLASALSTLGVASIGQPITEEQQAQLDALRAKVPADLQPDLDTLTEAYKQVGDVNGDLFKAAKILDSPEFRSAITRLSDYIQQGCPS